jgi:hypothetical protein
MWAWALGSPLHCVRFFDPSDSERLSGLFAVLGGLRPIRRSKGLATCGYRSLPARQFFFFFFFWFAGALFRGKILKSS